MNYLDQVKKEIQKALLSLTPGGQGWDKGLNFSVEIPELEHGDVTSNFCLVAAKSLGIKPQEVFEKVFVNLTQQLQNEVDRIEFKNPGFVNFYFKESFIRNKLNPKRAWWNFWQQDKLVSEKYDGKKILVEFTSVNLFKPFTIGHLMSNFTGEYVSRSLESQGAKVVRISYPSDISIGIAKAIWVIKNDGGLAQGVFKKPTSEIVKYLGECYVKGVNSYKNFEIESNLGKIQEVKIISNNLYGKIKSEDLEIYEFTKKINIDYFKGMIENLGTKFDGFIFESEAGEVGKKIVLANTSSVVNTKEHVFSGEINRTYTPTNPSSFVFSNSNGAVIYTPSEERKDINTSVFINSEGNPTYLAKDIGLLDLKFKQYSPLDYSIYIVDNEQNSHFKSVFDAAGKIKKEWQEKSVHVAHGRMTFKGQKMSSRLGGVPSGEEVIEAVLEDVKERSDEKIKDLDAEQKLNLQREIALSALRISILRSKPGVNIDFDPEKASSFEGDSGPYLCYTHARCSSLIEKASSMGMFPSLSKEKFGVDFSNIERKVLQFENILKTSAEEIAPQKLVKYLFELAGEFNSFYANTKILDESNLEKTKFNLYLTKLVKETLQKGLHVLGIKAPDKM